MKLNTYPDILSEVSKDLLLTHLKQIANWIRLSGSEEEAEALTYIKRRLNEYGYKVDEYSFEALIGYPKYAKLELLLPDPILFYGITAALAPSTPKEGVEAELIYVKRGDNYDGLDVGGKIVVIDGLFNPKLAKLAEENRAVGEVFINDDYLHEGIVSIVWGAPTSETIGLLPKTPCIALTSQQGAKILHHLQKGSVKAKLTTDSWIGWKKIPVLTGEINGASDDFILFSGHIDSWHYGAMDNASANSAMLEIARLLGKHRELLRRGLRLAFWSGHSHGRYAGSAWYADNFWADLYERCVAHVNIDSVGGKGATLFSEAYVMSEAKEFASSVVEYVVGEKLSGRRFSRAGDQSFWGIGVTSIFMSLSEQPPEALEGKKAPSFLLAPHSGGLGWWWHTTEDTVDKIDPDFLVRDTKVYLLLILNLCTTSIIPFDYSATLEEIEDRLREAKNLSAGRFDLNSLIERTTKVKHILKEFYKHVNSLNIVDESLLSKANQCIKRLGRFLVPINYSKVGPFDHDLAIPLSPLPVLDGVERLAKLPQDTIEARLLATKLRRESNKIVYALIEVEREVSVTLERMGIKYV
ncbi:MAG: M28 family peptidase [Nitrososphaerales archaeon]